MTCPHCQLSYDDFRTNLTYYEVYHMIFSRKHKRRHGVLGYWHQLKQEMWEIHKEECARAASSF